MAWHLFYFIYSVLEKVLNKSCERNIKEVEQKRFAQSNRFSKRTTTTTREGKKRTYIFCC